MNIKELAKQAGFYKSSARHFWYGEDAILEHFAELVRQDEREACAKHYLEIMRDAVEQAVLKEREACAAMCDELSGQVSNKNFIAIDQRQFCAKQIRKRGEK